MEAHTIEKLITSVGFPIVMVMILVYYIIKLMDRQTQELKELRKAINDNTNALGGILPLVKFIINSKENEK